MIRYPAVRRLSCGYEGGTVTACLRRGPSGASPISVALIHGLGATEAVWDRLIDLLPADIGVWTFGLPWDCAQGHRWALEPGTPAWLRRALRLVPEPPDVIVAHSFGANAVLAHMCATAVAVGAALVLISPFYRPSPEAFDWALISHYLNDFPDLLEASILAQRRGPPAPGHLAEMAVKVRDRIGCYGWLRFFELFAGTPMLNLTAIRSPCLVIGGANDTASYPGDCLDLAAALPLAAAEIIAQGGHFTMIDSTPAVAAHVTHFLDAQRRTPSGPNTSARHAEGKRK